MKAKAARLPRSPGRHPKNPPFRCRLGLGTITEARRTMARFIKAYDAAELSESQYRAHVYGMRGLLDYLQAERVLDLETRLEALEAKIAQLESGGGV